MSSAPSAKYLTKNELQAALGQITLDASFALMSQDSYNETLVIKAVDDTNRKSELCMAAINMACVGYGNKTYGVFKHGGNLVEITKLLVECGVKIALGKDAKLGEGDLTPQRLCRVFRENIRDYILTHNIETYLFRKYSTKDPNMKGVLFRGSEYLENLTPAQCRYILDTYKTLDAKLQLTTADRITRVFTAKGSVSKIV